MAEGRLMALSLSVDGRRGCGGVVAEVDVARLARSIPGSGKAIAIARVPIV